MNSKGLAIALGLLSCISFLCTAQTVEQIKADKAHFLCGEGWGETLKQADNAALSEITNQISVSVHSDFSTSEREGTQGKAFFSETEYKSVINTYSQATLTNTERIVLRNEPDAHVFRYIRKSEIHRIFEARKNKIAELAGIAESAESKGQVDDALRYYYWSYVLLKTMRYPNEVTFEDMQGATQLLITWLPYRINSVLGNLAVKYGKRSVVDPNVVEVFFTYKDQPVRSLQYTYFDGTDWSNVYNARDGVGIIELRPQSPDHIQIKYEYECYGEALIDNEVGEVLKAVKGEVFRKAYTALDLRAAPLPPTEVGKGAVPVTETRISHAVDKVETAGSLNDSREYADIVARVSRAITAKDFLAVKDCFTSEGYGIFKQLIQYGRASIVGTPQLSYLTFGDEVYCRNLMMSFAFANNSRKFVENVTFTFDKQRQISNVSFGLGRQATDDILKNSSWDNNSKLVLINFLENYKTAYALKRLDYISRIFSDDALIITGRVVNRAAPGREGTVNNKYVEFTRHNKTDYIRRLRANFLRNEFINIRFANNELVKMGQGGELYGIQIKQDYFSSSYGDTGYLFLMVDLNRPSEPVIHVRTWQPERDPDFGVIGPGHF